MECNKLGNAVLEKSFRFAVRIMNLGRYLQNEQREFVVAKQITRSGTSIGANINEAQQAQSKADFIHKMSIALKEAKETDYWLRLLNESKYISPKMFQSMAVQCDELIRLLVSIVKTSRENS